MKKIINILIHPYYTEESSKFLEVYDEQLENGNLNIILHPQVSLNLKKMILTKFNKEIKEAFLIVKNKNDVDELYSKDNVYKHLFHLHHTVLILRKIYFSSFFRHIKRKTTKNSSRKLNRKRSSKVLNKFIHRMDINKPIIKLSKKLTVFKDDVIFKFATDARKYLEDKFVTNKKQIVTHIDGGSFHTVESVIKHLKNVLHDDLKDYDVKVFGEYRNLCVKGLEDILNKYEIEYEVLDHLCSFNATNGKEIDKEDYFYIKKGSEDE